MEPSNFRGRGCAQTPCGLCVACFDRTAGARTADHRRRPVRLMPRPRSMAATCRRRRAVPGRDRPERAPVESRLAGARGAAEGRAEYFADHDRRRWLQRAFDIWRRHPDADAGSRRGKRPALHQLPHNVAVFADTRRADHRPQPSFGGLRRHLRAGNGISRLQQRSSQDTATVGRILLENGYRTSWFGKDHNTPTYQTSQAGPFDQWPTGMGFEYFYGFIGGDSSQWTPLLFRNTTQISPFVGNPSWNLITAMADEAIDWVNQLNAIDPSMPFLLYYVPGGTHAPHHPTPEWIKKASDLHLFDKGWNAMRDQIFANQKKLGVIPQDAKLTAWPTTC